ncbi:YbhN family protein [Corynebacterium sp. 35RC1]|nr:YbhN family protein [Corynebacterium sp. 35RC1]
MKNWLRFLGPLLILAVAAFLLRDKMPFLNEGYMEVREANAWILLLAFSAIVLSFFAMAEVMRILLGAGGAKVPLKETSRLTFISNAWSSTLPGGAAISTVYQFNTMRNWGVSVLVSSWFIVLSGAISTLWLVALGTAGVLFLGASFSIWPLLGTALLMVAVSVGLYVLTNNPKVLINVTHLLPRWKVRLDASLLQMEAVRLTPSRFAYSSALSLANWLLDIVGLWLCIWAVTGILPSWTRIGETPSFLAITLAFVTAKIVGTAQVTPAGVGPVEAAMTASLVAAGLPASTAFGVVLVYRVLAFVLPTVIGWLVYAVHVMRGGNRFDIHHPQQYPAGVGGGVSEGAVDDENPVGETKEQGQ